jgi:SAM-dependent methyltransferase
MKLHPQDLQKIAHLTLEHYNQRAEEFWEGTRDHNVSQNIEALLQHIEGEPPFTILDFGCGPGRDLKVFAEQGHVAVGLEGAEHFAAMARAHSGCEVWQQDFLKLELPGKYFDGVFANAALVNGSRGPRRIACCSRRVSSRKSAAKNAVSKRRPAGRKSNAPSHGTSRL